MNNDFGKQQMVPYRKAGICSYSLLLLAVFSVLGGCSSPLNTNKLASGIIAESGSPNASVSATGNGKKAFEESIDAELEKLRLDVEKTQEMLSMMGAEAQQETQQSVIIFNREIEDFAQEFYEFKQMTEGGWGEKKTAIETGLSELRESTFVMLTQVETDFQRFQEQEGNKIETVQN